MKIMDFTSQKPCRTYAQINFCIFDDFFGKLFHGIKKNQKSSRQEYFLFRLDGKYFLTHECKKLIKKSSKMQKSIWAYVLQGFLEVKSMIFMFFAFSSLLDQKVRKLRFSQKSALLGPKVRKVRIFMKITK